MLSNITAVLRDIVFGPPDNVDFEKAGIDVIQKAAAKLNLNENSLCTQSFDHINMIWRHRVTNAAIYVGDHKVAANENYLVTHNIKAIVNCTRPTSNLRGELPNYLCDSRHKFDYYEFPIANWYDHIEHKLTSKSILEFFMKMFKFVENALKRGESVLVHCLAGAHRAGTTGISLLMYFSEMSRVEATSAARMCRPVIDPIGHLPDCLKLLEVDLQQRRRSSTKLPPIHHLALQNAARSSPRHSDVKKIGSTSSTVASNSSSVERVPSGLSRSPSKQGLLCPTAVGGGALSRSTSKSDLSGGFPSGRSSESTQPQKSNVITSSFGAAGRPSPIQRARSYSTSGISAKSSLSNTPLQPLNLITEVRGRASTESNAVSSGQGQDNQHASAASDVITATKSPSGFSLLTGSFLPSFMKASPTAQPTAAAKITHNNKLPPLTSTKEESNKSSIGSLLFFTGTNSAKSPTAVTSPKSSIIVPAPSAPTARSPSSKAKTGRSRVAQSLVVPSTEMKPPLRRTNSYS